MGFADNIVNNVIYTNMHYSCVIISLCHSQIHIKQKFYRCCAWEILESYSSTSNTVYFYFGIMPFFFKFSILLLKIKMLFSCNSSLRCYTSSFLILLLICENHAGFLELFTTTGGRRGICTMFCIGRVVLLDLVFSTLNVLISLSNTLLLILLITWQFKTLKRL